MKFSFEMMWLFFYLWLHRVTFSVQTSLGFCIMKYSVKVRESKEGIQSLGPEVIFCTLFSGPNFLEEWNSQRSRGPAAEADSISQMPANIFISDHSLFTLQQLFSWTGGGSGCNSSKIILSSYRGLTFLELELVLPTEHPLAGKSVKPENVGTQDSLICINFYVYSNSKISREKHTLHLGWVSFPSDNSSVFLVEPQSKRRQKALRSSSLFPRWRN